MTSKQHLNVIVTPLVETDGLSEEDVGVAGTYGVEITADTPPRLGASYALDLFHRNVAIDVLDDFDIQVSDATGNPVEEDENHESYTHDGEDRIKWLGRLD